MHNHTNRIASALLMSTMLASPAAFAQDASQDTDFIEDIIIVEATRRATDIQDIPIAVTAITPVQLERQGIVNIADLASVTPGFSLQSSQTTSQGTSMRIRGVGTTGNNIGLESAVGVFIDGVYQSRPGIALGEMVDIEAVEMLRGPQGTLFGRNVTAGLLNVRTRAPEFTEFSGFLNATYGNYDLMNLQGALNMPVSDTLAFRATGSWRQRDGFMSSTIVPGGESQDRDRFILRGQALWEPTDATSLRLIAEYQDVDEKCCAAVTLSTSPLLSDATRAEIFPEVGFDALDDRRFNDQEFFNFSDTTNLSAELNHDFGDVTATLIGSYSNFDAGSEQQEFNGGLQYTTGGVTIPQNDRIAVDLIDTYTAELRFQGEAFDDRLDWIVGAYYADESIVEDFSLGLGPDYSRLVAEANFGSPATLSTVAGAGLVVAPLLAGQAADPTAFAPLSADGQYARNFFEQDAESWSLFTHNIFAVTDTVNLTLGARYVDDSKSGSFEQIGSGGTSCSTSLALLGALGNPATQGAAAGALDSIPVAPGVTLLDVLNTPTSPGNTVATSGAFLNCFPFAAPAVGSPFLNPAFSGIPFLPQEYDLDFDDEELIYTAKLDWAATPNLLLFGGFTHGYKAGGFNLDASAGAGGGDPRFASEEIDAWEVGMKSTIANGRLRFNVTGFWQEMDNFQVLEFTGTRFQTFNADDVSSKGVEVELNGRLSDVVFINAGVTYTDAGYGDDCDKNGAVPEASQLCGASLTNAPKWSSVLGLTYDGDLADTDWGFLANINLSTSSKRRTSTNPEVLGSPGVLIPFDDQDGFTKINARIGFTMPNDRVSIEFWGLNLTDEITRGITFNTPLQGASRSAFPDAPRQYGVTLRTQF